MYYDCQTDNTYLWHQFLERCLSEKADVVKEALYSTAKVVAYKERARVSVSDEVFSHDALKRMLQNVEPLISSVWFFS